MIKDVTVASYNNIFVCDGVNAKSSPFRVTLAFKNSVSKLKGTKTVANGENFKTSLRLYNLPMASLDDFLLKDC